MHLQTLTLMLAILLLAGCKKDECEFHYNKYFIDFSEESRQQHPLLDKDSIIVESIFGIDTSKLKKDLAGEGTRKRKVSWTCASDSTIIEQYEYFYTQKVAHFKPIGFQYTIAMSLITCPDRYDPWNYAEYFELLVSTNFNTAFGDHLRLIRFMTNQGDATCSFTPLGEFHEEITIDSVTYTNVWYNEGDFANHHFSVYYSTDVGLIRFYIDFFPYEVLGSF